MAAVWRSLGMRRRRPTTALPIHVRRRRTAWNSVGSGGRAVATCLPMFKTIGCLGAEISRVQTGTLWGGSGRARRIDGDPFGGLEEDDERKATLLSAGPSEV